MHQAKSRRCRLVDQDGTFWLQEMLWLKWSMSKHTVQRNKRKICRTLKIFVTEGNEKADEFANSGAILDEGFMAEARSETMQQEREECMQPCSTQLAFIV